VDYQVNVSPAAFAKNMSPAAFAKNRNTLVHGIANGAYYYKGPPFGSALTVLDGTTVFEIQANVSLERLEALAKKLVPLARS